MARQTNRKVRKPGVSRINENLFAPLSLGNSMRGPAPCELGKVRGRKGTAILCMADWRKEYGLKWRSPAGYVKSRYFCEHLCEKRPDIFTVTLKEKRNAEVL